MVEGSGGQGAPKYVGEGVTYGVFLVALHIGVPSDASCQIAFTLAYVVMM